MTKRKPPTEKWESYVERQIREAQEDGQFDGLSGLGKPCAAIDEPMSEDWWLKRKVKHERLSCLPPALAIKLDVQKTLERIRKMSGDERVRRELVSLNERIRKANFALTWGPPANLMELDVELYLERWRNGKPG